MSIERGKIKVASPIPVPVETAAPHVRVPEKAVAAPLPDPNALNALKGPSKFGNPFKLFGSLVDLSEVAPDQNIAVAGADWAFKTLENPQFPRDADNLLSILRDRGLPA